MAQVPELETGVVNVETMPQIRGVRSAEDMIKGSDTNARKAALEVVRPFGGLDEMNRVIRQLVDCPDCPRPINGQSYRKH